MPFYGIFTNTNRAEKTLTGYKYVVTMIKKIKRYNKMKLKNSQSDSEIEFVTGSE